MADNQATQALIEEARSLQAEFLRIEGEQSWTESVVRRLADALEASEARADELREKVKALARIVDGYQRSSSYAGAVPDIIVAFGGVDAVRLLADSQDNQEATNG